MIDLGQQVKVDKGSWNRFRERIIPRAIVRVFDIDTLMKTDRDSKYSGALDFLLEKEKESKSNFGKWLDHWRKDRQHKLNEPDFLQKLVEAAVVPTEKREQVLNQVISRHQQCWAEFSPPAQASKKRTRDDKNAGAGAPREKKSTPPAKSSKTT